MYTYRNTCMKKYWYICIYIDEKNRVTHLGTNNASCRTQGYCRKRSSEKSGDHPRLNFWCWTVAKRQGMKRRQGLGGWRQLPSRDSVAEPQLQDHRQCPQSRFKEVVEKFLRVPEKLKWYTCLGDTWNEEKIPATKGCLIWKSKSRARARTGN